MIRHLLVCSVACVLLVGCGQGTGPTAHSYAKYDLAGGRYFIDCEDTGGGSSLAFSSASEGSTVTRELYKFSWAGTHELRIEDAQLTVDGRDQGTLQPGDRITIKASGELLVNGSRQ